MNTRPDQPDDESAPQLGGPGGAKESADDMHRVAGQTMRAPFRRSAPHTSRDAAAKAQRTSPTMRGRVLCFLIGQGQSGATDEEGGAALCMKPQSYTPRRRELVKRGLVRDSGERRATESGRSAVVWVVSNAGNTGNKEGVQ